MKNILYNNQVSKTRNKKIFKMIRDLFSFFLLKKLLKGKSLNIIKPKKIGATEIKYWILPHSPINYEQQTKINLFCGHS